MSRVRYFFVNTELRRLQDLFECSAFVAHLCSQILLVEHLIQHAHIYSLGSFQVKPKQASPSTHTHSQPPSAGSRGVEFPPFAVSFLFHTLGQNYFFVQHFGCLIHILTRKTFHFAIKKNSNSLFFNSPLHFFARPNIFMSSPLHYQVTTYSDSAFVTKSLL